MNAAPTIGALLFNNSSPSTTDTLQVQVVDASDPDGDSLTFQYDWRVNGQLVQSTTSSTTTITLALSQPGYGDRGDLIEVFVTVSDSYASGTPREDALALLNSVQSFNVGNRRVAVVNGTHGVGDFPQIVLNELGAETIADLRAATQIELAA